MAEPKGPWEEPIQTLINSFTKRLRVRLIQRLMTVYLKGSAEMVEYGRTITTDRPIFFEGPPIQQAYEWASKHCATLVTKMDDETKARLAQVVADAIENKRGIDGLARDIRKEIEDMSTYRSRMIARTETAQALEQAFIDRAPDLGVTGKRWIVTDPCDVCMANGNEGPVPIAEDAYFDTEGNPIGRPPAHPNCRCALAPVMLRESLPGGNTEDSIEEGGEGSGNWGHAGRPGEVGGSGKGSGFKVGGTMRALRRSGGFSQDVKGTIPRTGFMVSPYKGREMIIENNYISTKDIAKYAIANRDVLTQVENYLGGWTEEGKVYLDVSVRTATKEAAMTIARANNQLAIYDIEKGVTINVE